MSVDPLDAIIRRERDAEQEFAETLGREIEWVERFRVRVLGHIAAYQESIRRCDQRIAAAEREIKRRRLMLREAGVALPEDGKA